MQYRNQLLAVTAACTLMFSAIPSNVAAQQTTQDGVRLENAVNRPERPYRQADLRTRATAAHTLRRDSASATGVWSM